jgi:thymidylate kinase
MSFSENRRAVEAEGDRELAELEELEQRAEECSRRLNPDVEPVVVEFAGSPKSGKSTTIDILVHFFKRMGMKVAAPTEGASKRTPYYLRRDLVAFNSWTLCYAISELLSNYYDNDRPSLIIMDRGPFDSLAWMGLLHNRGELSDDEFDHIKQFALHPRWTNLMSRLYLFTCSPHTSLERETASKLTLRGGTAMNPELLQKLLDEYQQMSDLLSQYPVRAVDTSLGTTPRSTAKELAEDILDLWEARM